MLAKFTGSFLQVKRAFFEKHKIDLNL